MKFMTNVTTKCSFCNKPIMPTDLFCPSCGNKLNVETPLTMGQKIKIYVASVLLAPLGFIWFFKYYKSSDEEKRKTAYASLIITIVMVLVLITINVAFINSVKSYLDLYKQSLGSDGLSL